MLSPDALKTMDVMFATPCYNASAGMYFAASLFNLGTSAARAGLRATLHMASSSLVTQARNGMVAQFLSQDFTHLFWMDSDIGFSPQDVFRLLLADWEIVAGVYPFKRMYWPPVMPAGLPGAAFETVFADFPFSPLKPGLRAYRGDLDADGLLEVAAAPTGFMAIRRSAFERLILRDPNLRYRSELPPEDARAAHSYLFYECFTDPATGEHLSEDFAFCRRWRDIGGSLYVDPQYDLTHQGSHSFRGSLARTLQAQSRW